jgi:hypothetical protein
MARLVYGGVNANQWPRSRGEIVVLEIDDNDCLLVHGVHPFEASLMDGNQR